MSPGLQPIPPCTACAPSSGRNSLYISSIRIFRFCVESCELFFWILRAEHVLEPLRAFSCQTSRPQEPTILRFSENWVPPGPVGGPISFRISMKVGHSTLRATNLLCDVSLGPSLLAQGKGDPLVSLSGGDFPRGIELRIEMYYSSSQSALQHLRFM